MNNIIIYSTIIHICNEKNFKLLKFFILDILRKKFKKNKFLIILFMSKNINKNKFLYRFLDSYITKNYKKIINFFVNDYDPL